MNIYLKIGRTELSLENCIMIYNKCHYIIKYNGVYHLYWSEAQNKFISIKDVDVKGITKKGTFFTANTKDANYFLERNGYGKNYLCDLEAKR